MIKYDELEDFIAFSCKLIVLATLARRFRKKPQ